MGRTLVAVAAIGAALYMYFTAGGYPGAARRLPEILSILVIVLSLLAIVQALVEVRRKRAERGKPLFTMPDWTKVGIGLAFVALVAAYAWSIPVIGYLIATPLMLALPLIALRPVGWPAIGITIVSVTGVIWLIFLWFLNLPIPLFPGA